ncbi:GntR family transcriptional regulator [Roseateles koreensis]|uniref:GntR family transcriptional regulator n=1 Tax=Roseateles koreensis TaxID=2987526 RepID=A0ABT5KQR8_9BURK|nr:GntR family transcriptional regulator [Roseateles koreensis]MDC8785249.1 GntR family transcriptional regulator [Roseateles koreensis]
MGNASAGICRSLTEDIVSGRLPPGQKLEELVLAERFQVSRTPIREALRELHARGLIALEPRKGGIVRSIGLQDLSDMLEAMVELDALCCRISAERMSAVQKKQLAMVQAQSEECVARGDEVGYLGLNHQFHQLISAGAQNHTLTEMLSKLRERLAPFRAAQTKVERRLAVSHDEHQAILAAIQSGDAEAAYEAMRNHTARLSINVLDLLRQQQNGGEAGSADSTPQSAAQASRSTVTASEKSTAKKTVPRKRTTPAAATQIGKVDKISKANNSAKVLAPVKVSRAVKGR